MCLLWIIGQGILPYQPIGQVQVNMGTGTERRQTAVMPRPQVKHPDIRRERMDLVYPDSVQRFFHNIPSCGGPARHMP